MLSRIVVGSDGSATAREALGQAAELAKAVGATLEIVRAYAEREPRDSAAAYEPTLQEGSDTAGLPSDVARPVGPRADALASLEEEVAFAVGAGVPEVTSTARGGDPAEVIIDIAEETKADLIVVGNKGMTGAARFLLGSVPNKITHHAPCNVLVVRTT
jgi:nucleotide-binding universal stress UspA family protein